jgi:hypothetical protein
MRNEKLKRRRNVFDDIVYQEILLLSYQCYIIINNASAIELTKKIKAVERTVYGWIE